MDAQRRSGLLFCPLTGSLLEVDPSRGVVSSRASSFALPLSSVLGRERVVQEVDMADYARRYALEPLVRPRAEADHAEQAIGARTRATVDEPCPKCGNPEMEFYTLQLRSADEGQTVFYECPKCGHKYSTNN